MQYAMSYADGVLKCGRGDGDLPMAALPADYIAGHLDTAAEGSSGRGGTSCPESFPLEVISFNAQTLLSLAKRQSFDKQLGALGVAVAVSKSLGVARPSWRSATIFGGSCRQARRKAFFDVKCGFRTSCQ